MTECNDISGYLIAGAFTVIGAVVGGFSAYLGAIKISEKQRFVSAVFRLRDAFAPEIARIQSPEGFGLADVPLILQSAFYKHQIAVNDFSFFLAGKDLVSFNKLWREYCDCEEGKIPGFYEYGLPTDESTKIAIRRMKAIINFANI